MDSLSGGQRLSIRAVETLLHSDATRTTPSVVIKHFSTHGSASSLRPLLNMTPCRFLVDSPETFRGSAPIRRMDPAESVETSGSDPEQAETCDGQVSQSFWHQQSEDRPASSCASEDIVEGPDLVWFILTRGVLVELISLTRVHIGSVNSLPVHLPGR